MKPWLDLSTLILLFMAVAASTFGSRARRNHPEISRKRAAIPSIVHDGQAVLNNSDIRVSEGTSLVLECAVNFKGKDNDVVLDHQEEDVNLKYEWIDASNQIVSRSKNYEVSNVYSEDGKSLRFGCGVEADGIATRSFVNVKVSSPPSFTITRVPAFGIPVLEGMTVLLSCDIDLDDDKSQTLPSGPQWMKDEEKIRSEGKTVTIMSVGMDDVGWYQCFIDVDDERFSSVGYFLNIIPQDHQDGGSRGGEGDDEVIRDTRPNSISSGDNNDHDVDRQSPTSPPRRPMATNHGGHKNVQQLAAGSVIYEDGGGSWTNCSCCDGHQGHGGGLGKEMANSIGRHYPPKSPKHLYTGPLIRMLNHSRIVLRHAIGGGGSGSGEGENETSSSTLVLSAEVCSNPKAHKIMWLTPDARAIKTGQTVDNFSARKTVLHPERVTCVTSHLDIDLRSSNGFLAKTQEGEYFVIAKNHHGVSEAAHPIVVRNAHHLINNNMAAEKITNSSSSSLSPIGLRSTIPIILCLFIVIAKHFSLTTIPLLYYYCPTQSSQ